jgi:hypothetical protein
MNESESVDLIRIALISLHRRRVIPSLRLSGAIEADKHKSYRRFPVEARYCVSRDDEASAGCRNDCRRLLGNCRVIRRVGYASEWQQSHKQVSLEHEWSEWQPRPWPHPQPMP